MKNRAQGMTLIELMTAMLVLAILMGIAVPSFRDFASDSRTTAATTDLVTALNLARSEALRRATLVVACASDDDLKDCSDDKDWTKGWIVFADPNGNGKVDADELLQTWEGPSGQIEAQANADRAVYNAMGMAQLQPVLAEVAFDVQLYGFRGDRRKHVTMSPMGSLRTTRVVCQ
jgi:type IV fimbrial biogenesis protein FimT